MTDHVVLTISKATLAAIGRGLGELPYKVAAPAVAEIDRQLIELAQAEQKTPASVDLPVDSPKG